LDWIGLKSGEQSNRSLSTGKNRLLANNRRPFIDNSRPLADNHCSLANKHRLLTDKRRLLADKCRSLANNHRLLADKRRPLANICRSLANNRRLLANMTPCLQTRGHVWTPPAGLLSSILADLQRFTQKWAKNDSLEPSGDRQNDGFRQNPVFGHFRPPQDRCQRQFSNGY
jgi:hypothetical protein